MCASLDKYNFNPEDPTVGLWKRLLRRRPPKDSYKPRTRAERRAAAIRTQEYYTDKPHPRVGGPFGKKKK